MSIKATCLCKELIFLRFYGSKTVYLVTLLVYHSVVKYLNTWLNFVIFGHSYLKKVFIVVNTALPRCDFGLVTVRHGIDLVLYHQMALAKENPLDGASSKCILPCIQILEGPVPSLGFLFGAFSCCFAHAPSVLGLV